MRETTPGYQATTGHGHVTPSRDGVKARCGGPAICSVCQEEQRQMDAVHQQRQANAQPEGPCLDCAEVGHAHTAGRCRVVFEEHGGLRECECGRVVPSPVPDPQISEERRIDRLRIALKRSGVDWPTIHRLDDIRYMVGPEIQEGVDCSGCNEHVLLALVDRLTAENERLRTDLAAERERNAPLRARIREATTRADRATKEAQHAAWESWSRLFRPLNEAMATERKLEAATAELQAAEQREARLADWTVREGGWRIFHYADLPIPPDTFDLTDRINPDLAPRLRALLADDAESAST